MTVWDDRNIVAQSTVIVSGPHADLIAVVVNTAAAASVVKVWDGANLTTTNLRPVATIDASATGNFFYGNHCRNGITVAMSGGTSDITVIFDQGSQYEPDQ